MKIALLKLKQPVEGYGYEGRFGNRYFGMFHVFYDSYNVYVLTPSEVIRILTFSFLELTSNPIVVLSFFLYLMFLHLGKGFVLKRVSLAMVIDIDIDETYTISISF